MAESLEIATVCESVIANPEINLNSVEHFVTKEDPVVILALSKVFKNICPLYKIRLHSKKTTTKGLNDKVTPFDTLLIKRYSSFISTICKSNLVESFKAACVLLKNLEHFNFGDRLVSKVLIGTTKVEVKEMCIETIIELVRFGKETLHIVLDKCLDYRFNEEICQAITSSEYLNTCVGIRIAKEEKYLKSKKSKVVEKLSKDDKKFFKKNYSKIKASKVEKQRLIVQSQNRKEDNEEMGEIDDKLYVKTINAFQRFVFTILKSQNQKCLVNIFESIRKFKRIIRKEFHEGLRFLINENIKLNTNDELYVTTGISGSLAMLDFFGDLNYDFKHLIDFVFSLHLPYTDSINNNNINNITELINLLFIRQKQSRSRTVSLVFRMMHVLCSRYLYELEELMTRLCVNYDIDMKEHFHCPGKKLFSSDDIDNSSPESNNIYFIYKRFKL